MFSKSKEKDLLKDKEILLSQFPSSSRFAESYRTLRTNLFFSVMEKDLNSVVVTSSVEGEGKTTTCVNLAYSIAQADRNVLLVDMDLRRPHLTSLFGMRKEAGVSNLVTEVFGTHLTHGSLDKFSPDDLIELTRLQARTCRLELDDGKDQVAVFFDKGRIVDIYWKNRPEGKKLANSLIKEKLLTEKEALAALGHQKKSVQRLGTILYTMGFVSKKDIARALSMHTIEAIKALSGITQGHFAFAQVSREDITLSISQDIDFQKLYMEFNIGGSEKGFIKTEVEKLIRPTGIPNLSLLPAGFVPPNPSELVGSERNRFLIELLKEMYDFIIIDTPPVMPATDAVLISPKTDGVILVIRSGHAEKRIIQEALSQFETAGTRVIGTVLNRVDLKGEGYYRYYKKYYASYYGQN